MPGEKITYFKEFRGYAEISRMLLSMSGQPWEREDLTREEFQARKTEFPTGQLPALTLEDGRILPQSGAMYRFLAKKYGFVGSSPWDEALNDAMMENLKDVMELGRPIVSWKIMQSAPKPEDGDKQVEAFKEKWVKVTQLAEKQAGSNKFLVSDEIQVSDIALWYWMDVSKAILPEVTEINDWIKGFNERFTSDDRVKEYRASQPPYKF